MGRTRRRVRENGLSLVLLAVFVALLVAQALVGAHELNADRAEHGLESLTLRQYLVSGHFIETTAENWESEFLQMAAYVLLTVVLVQKGSSESKKPEGGEAVDADPRKVRGKALENAPWPVRRGGWMLDGVRALSVARIRAVVSRFLHCTRDWRRQGV